MKRLEPNETRAIIGRTTGRARNAIEFLSRTGARVSEALMVRTDDVDPARGVVSIPTLKRRGAVAPKREVPIPADYARELAGLTPPGRLFPITRARVWDAMQEGAKAAGIPANRAHPHALRHSFAIRNVEAGIPLPVIRRWLGHADYKALLVYTEEVEASKWKPAV